MTIAVVVIVTMGDLPYINIRILARKVRERQVSVCVCLLDIPPGVVAAMLTEGDGVLLPSLVVSHEVDCIMSLYLYLLQPCGSLLRWLASIQ